MSKKVVSSPVVAVQCRAQSVVWLYAVYWCHVRILADLSCRLLVAENMQISLDPTSSASERLLLLLLHTADTVGAVGLSSAACA
jgi:hypothetical protein